MMEVENNQSCCCLCRKLTTQNLVKFTAKGLERLKDVVFQNNDEPLANVITDLGLEIEYHHKCYVYYLRKSSKSDKKENNQTPLRSKENLPPARKRTRYSPLHDESLCVVCEKKSWRKGKLIKYNGDISDWQAEVSNSDEAVLERLVVAEQHGMDILYHRSCQLDLRYKTDFGQNILSQTPCLPQSHTDTPEAQLPTHEHDTVETPNPQMSGSNPNESTELDIANSHDGKLVIEAALVIRDELKSFKTSRNRDEGLEVTATEFNDFSPQLLSLFVATVVESNKKSTTVSSICQDIIYVGFSVRTPKHVALAMTLRHMTGSRKLLTMLNKFGHCSTYIDTLRTECMVANSVLKAHRELGVYVPSNLKRGGFIFSAVDNIDFSEATKDGKNTTHGTNMIMFQQQDTCDSSQVSPFHVTSPGTSLSLEGDGLYSNIVTGFTQPNTTNIFPAESLVDCSYLEINGGFVEQCVSENKNWVKARTGDILAPTWCAFNARRQNSPQTPTTLSYLPMVNSPASSYTTIYTCMKVLQDNTRYLGQENAVIFMDQAMYSKAKELTLANPDAFPTTLIMMGGFHINMNFLSAVGTIVSELGWVDIFRESGIFGDSVITNLLNAKPYTRCLSAHIAMYEVMRKLKSRRDDRLGEMQEISATAKYWDLYIYLIDICLSQLYAERTGSWTLYLDVLSAMVPVFFATDRQNYARWLSVYLHDMQQLDKTAPMVFDQFMAGNFVVKRSSNRFSAVSPDMALEQSINRDVKCQGGLIGKACMDGARDKWFLTSHMKATVSAELNNMMDSGEGANGEHKNLHHSDNTYDQKKSVEWPTEIMCLLEERQLDPFAIDLPKEEINNLVTGITRSKEDSNKILNSLSAAKTNHQAFVQARLVDRSMKIKESIKRMNIPYKQKTSGAEKGKPAKNSKPDEKASILGRLLVGSNVDDVNVTDILNKMDDHPPSLANEDGSMRKTDKAQLKHILVSELAADHVSSAAPSMSIGIDESSSMIIDGMAFVHRLRPQSNISFEAYAKELIKSILRDMRGKNISRCDVIFDRYVDKPLKSQERKKRCHQKTPYKFSINSAKMKVPKDWELFLGSSDNKKELINFLSSAWRLETSLLKTNESLVVSTQDDTIRMSVHGITSMPDLKNNHEEADTIVALHLKSHLCVYSNITVVSDDTDVLVILIHFINKWRVQDHLIWMLTKQKLIPLHALVDMLDVKCEVVIGLHALTGCDTVSSIYGISKSKAYKRQSEALNGLGEAETCNPSSLVPYFYSLYGMDHFKGNLCQLRYKLFCEKGLMGKQLPPTDSDFELHCARANMQAYLWKQADSQMMVLPEPTLHGWSECGGVYLPRYSCGGDRKAISKLVQACKCKRGCSNLKCVCMRSGSTCSDLCSCAGCTNC